MGRHCSQIDAEGLRLLAAPASWRWCGNAEVFGAGVGWGSGGLLDGKRTHAEAWRLPAHPEVRLGGKILEEMWHQWELEQGHRSN